MSLSQFDRDGNRLAILGSDGLLCIWQHVQGNAPTLSQKFATSSHLSAAPSCLLWSSGQGSDKDLIALGTEAGNVYVYSCSLTRLVASKTVTGKVLSLCWGDDNCLYIGCDNGSVHIVTIGGAGGHQASVISHPSLHSPVHSLAVHNNVLALGSRSIILWDVKKNFIIKTLTGSASGAWITHDRILFSSKSERVVSLWNVPKKKTGSIASLVVNDDISSVDVQQIQNQDDNNTLVSVVTTRGMACLFKLNTKSTSGSVQPIANINITNPEENNLPIITARIVENTERLSVYYSDIASVHTPQMEELTISELQPKTHLVRKIKRDKKQSKTDTEVVTPKTDGKVVFLAPGPSLGSNNSTNSRKRQAGKQNENSLPVEERLSLLSTSTTSTSSPRTDTMTQLLVQGLHSNDSRILDSVLDRADLTLIDNTVRRLPAEAVLPLVTVLQKYLRGRGVMHASHAKWLKSVLTIHTGFLVSVPDCETILSPVYALLEARTQNYCQVLQLRGKLDMLMKQSDDKQTDNNLDVEQEALAVYQDTSSDDSSDDMMSDLMINEENEVDYDEDDEEEENDSESDDNDEEMVSD